MTESNNDISIPLHDEQEMSSPPAEDLAMVNEEDQAGEGLVNTMEAPLEGDDDIDEESTASQERPSSPTVVSAAEDEAQATSHAIATSVPTDSPEATEPLTIDHIESFFIFPGSIGFQ